MITISEVQPLIRAIEFTSANQTALEMRLRETLQKAA
jgi:hypothetical protein